MCPWQCRTRTLGISKPGRLVRVVPIALYVSGDSRHHTNFPINADIAENIGVAALKDAEVF